MLSRSALLLTLSLGVSLCVPSYVRAAPDELLEIPLEKLVDVEVTSVSKKKQKAQNAPAAVFVISSEDIKRIGATSIPEALKIVPGLQVAQIDSNKWAVSSRGFINQFSNKLLVLMDGRTVYTPIFSGTYWDVQDTVLEDVDRIEVIRGPGATLWGANAVNGVINIITKNAKYTQGTFASATVGTREQAAGEGRYGGKVGENTYYRAYGKYFQRSDSDNLSGNNNHDGWDRTQTGFRVDMEQVGGNANKQLTVQADAYYGENDIRFVFPSLNAPYQTVTDDEGHMTGGNVLARLHEKLSDTSGYTLQSYFDHTRRNENVANQRLSAWDVDFQYNFAAGDRQDIIWGAGYRVTQDVFDGGEFVTLYDNHDVYDVWNAFIQDDITLLPDELILTLGTKFELNDYNGASIQPNARLTYMPNETNTVWASVSRASRTPSRIADGINAVLRPIPPNSLYSGSPAGFVRVQGDTQLEDERLIAYELGYRVKPLESVSVDVATFYNDYSNLFTIEQGAPYLDSSTSLAPHLVVPIRFQEMAEGASRGVELSSTWQVLPQWRLTGGYSYINIDVDPDPGSTDSSQISAEENTPHHLFNMRSSLNLSHGVQMDNMLYYSGDIFAQDFSSSLDVEGYYQFDSRLAWKAMDGVELSVVGKNLFDENHPEFTAPVYQQAAQVGRSVYGQVRLNY